MIYIIHQLHCQVPPSNVRLYNIMHYVAFDYRSDKWNSLTYVENVYAATFF